LKINESQIKSLRAKAALDIKTVIEDFGRQVKRLNEVDWRNMYLCINIQNTKQNLFLKSSSFQTIFIFFEK
jgi:hypothetical protein